MGTPKPRQTKKAKVVNGLVVTEADRQLYKQQGFKSPEERAAFLAQSRKIQEEEINAKASQLAKSVDQRLILEGQA